MDTIYGTDRTGKVLLENEYGPRIWIRTIAPQEPSSRYMPLDVTLSADDARALALDLLTCADELEQYEAEASEYRKRHEGGEACHDCAGGEDGEEDEDCLYFSG